jgi:hypothetical protein
MEYPRTTKSDIEDKVSLSIVVKVTDSQEFDDGNEMYYLRDIEGNETRLKIWNEETDRYEIETGEWYLFQDAEGDTYGEPMLGSNRGDMEAIALDKPPEFVEEPTEVETEEVTEGGTLAVDIETISIVPEDELDLDNSDHVSLLCIGVGYTPEVGMPGNSTVLFREGSSECDEAALLERFCEYVEDRNPDQLVLFKGDFDLTHLQGRASRVDDNGNLSSRVESVFDTHRVVNLTPPGSLEDNFDVIPTYWDIYQHSLDPAEWRRSHPNYTGELDNPKVTNKDIPYFGERYIELRDSSATNQEFRALHELIRHYTKSDIDPLFRLVARKK